MVPDVSNWVRKAACPTELAGGQCIADAEVLTHHAALKGQYNNAPRPDFEEDEVSLQRGAISKAEACRRRNRNQPVPEQDVARAGIRRTTAGELRAAGFAVVHTCGRRGESNGHVSVIWPADQPLERRRADWPPKVQEAFAACFTEQDG